MAEPMLTRRAGPMIGLMLPAVANTGDGKVDVHRLLEAARRAEAAGFDGVYVGDHLLHPRPLMESLITLAAVAATTERITVGACVLLLALRNPLWLAKQLGTLAAFAPGRLRIGVGVGGEYPAEFEALGIALGERGRRTEEVLEQVRGLLSGRVSPAPEGTTIEVGLSPLPEHPVPFLLGGWKEVALKRAAAMGDGWIGYLLSPESFARRRAFLLDRRAELGGGDFTTGMLLPVYPDSELAGSRARAAGAWSLITDNNVSFPEHLFLAGTAEDLADQIHAYWQAGCDEMILALVDQGDSYLKGLETLAKAVLPRIRAFTHRR